MHAIRGFKTFFVAVAAFSSALLLFYVFDTDYIQNSNIYDISLLVNGSQEEETSETLLLEILSLVHNTPNLWGFRKEDDHETRKTETRTSRIMQQREWVSNVAKTHFVKKSKAKKIIVFSDGAADLFRYTGNKVQCPYAPNFTSKCELAFIHKTQREELQSPDESYVYKYTMHADAVVTVRNGYWSFDKYFPEPRPAAGIHSVMYTSESPCHTGSARYGELGAWASNYWRGSDLPVGNRGIVRVNYPEKSYETHFEKLPPTTPPSERKQLVAALISNCILVKNGRISYIHALGKYMDVHFYGACGDRQCPPSKDMGQRDDCLSHIQKNYKFYLAFENCNCRDYITEKFFLTSLIKGVVPVVMGAPRSDYEEVAPPNSFIHVDDFQGPKELASYLLKLDKNFTEYKKYLEWRDQGNWAYENDSVYDVFCRMCGMIYYADFRPPTPWPHRTTRFRDVTQCAPSGQWNWNMTIQKELKPLNNR